MNSSNKGSGGAPSRKRRKKQRARRFEADQSQVASSSKTPSLEILDSTLRDFNVRSPPVFDEEIPDLSLPSPFLLHARPHDISDHSAMAPATPSMAKDDPPGPHPSFIEVAKPYIFEQKLQDCMKIIGMNEAKEDVVRLQGVAWIDQVRKALQLYEPSSPSQSAPTNQSFTDQSGHSTQQLSTIISFDLFMQTRNMATKMLPLPRCSLHARLKTLSRSRVRSYVQRRTSSSVPLIN